MEGNKEKVTPVQQTPTQQKQEISLLEEDDEFEEFENETWNKTEEEEEVEHQWVDDWDDEHVDDDFSKQLRAELEKDKGLQPMKD